MKYHAIWNKTGSLDVWANRAWVDYVGHYDHVPSYMAQKANDILSNRANLIALVRESELEDQIEFYEKRLGQTIERRGW